MDFIAKNWYLIVAGIAVIIFVVFACVKFFKLPTAKQIENLKKWLRYAVAQAEAALGSKTGALKLQMVYDMAISKFPWVATFISFEDFKGFVDEALDWLERQCQTTPKIDYMVHTNDPIMIPQDEPGFIGNEKA